MVDKFSKNIFTENIERKGSVSLSCVKSYSSDLIDKGLDGKSKKKIASLDNLLSSKKINLVDLQSIAWSGLPFGMIYLNILTFQERVTEIQK